MEQNLQDYSWVAYEIPGHKVGMCKESNYPKRPRVQLNALLGLPKHTRNDGNTYKALATLHEITNAEAREVETEWQDKLGYPADVDINLNLKHTAEVRAKISASMLGKNSGPFSEEHKANMSAAQKGRTFSAETRAKMSASAKGKILSAETRAKLSVAGKARYARVRKEDV